MTCTIFHFGFAARASHDLAVAGLNSVQVGDGIDDNVTDSWTIVQAKHGPFPGRANKK